MDLSNGLAVFEIQGSAAGELLFNGCGLELHPQSLEPGQCARTRFAGIPVVVECLDGPPRIELMVAMSYSQYLHAWLTDVKLEFQSVSVKALPVDS